MNEQETSDEELLLDHELIDGDESDGEDSITHEPGVLILEDEVREAPAVKKIEVKARKANMSWPEQETGQEMKFKPSFPAPTPVATRPGNQGENYLVSSASKAGLTDTSLPQKFGQNAMPSSPSWSSRKLSKVEQLLGEARKLAKAYGDHEARTRSALYLALGGAYDLSLALLADREAYGELLEKADLTVQERAPYTPIVKLVFGADYDRTRVTEFAAIISYCMRRKIGEGECAAFIEHMPGGIKHIVEMERRLRKGQTDEEAAIERATARPAIARMLRKLPTMSFDDMQEEGDEFTLVLARRLPDGGVGVLGEMPRDVRILESAARKFLSELSRKPD